MSIGLVITLMIAVSIFINLKKPERIKYAVWISIWGSFVALGLLAYFCYDEYSRVSSFLIKLLRKSQLDVFKIRISITAEDQELTSSK